MYDDQSYEEPKILKTHNAGSVLKVDVELKEEIKERFLDEVKRQIIDEVNAPPHYTENRKIQPIDVIEDWELDFRLSNVIKYIARYNKKGTPKQDLEKAQWYLNRFIERM